MEKTVVELKDNNNNKVVVENGFHEVSFHSGLFIFYDFCQFCFVSISFHVDWFHWKFNLFFKLGQRSSCMILFTGLLIHSFDALDATSHHRLLMILTRITGVIIKSFYSNTRTRRNKSRNSLCGFHFHRKIFR